jgi:NAD(P)-dependent dehydrogenase (short-subunit alcohol dehydrogenase family)
MSTVLIIGASRGIGLEFARQYAADGARVIGTVRRSEDAARLRELGARPLLLDVVDEATVAEFGVQLHGEKLDVAISTPASTVRAPAQSPRPAAWTSTLSCTPMCVPRCS